MHRPNIFRAVLLALVFPAALLAQNAPVVGKLPKFFPLAIPKLTPGQVELIQLETKFSDDVAKGGGKAFASWFAPDGVTLNNGQPAVLGQTAIAASAQWNPKNYHLSWYPEGAQMGPSSDAGFTWGHYDAESKDAKGKSSILSGRYITFWKKVNGVWKVALDASAKEPATGPSIIP